MTSRNPAAMPFPFSMLDVSILGFGRVLSMIMKKTTRIHSPSVASHRGGARCRAQGRWAFNLASERLFALGSTERIRRGAYLTAQGEMRFLPL